MALSNIFREPRREITETLVGIMLVSVPVAGDYWFGVWLRAATEGNNPIGLAAGMVIGVCLIFCVGVALLLLFLLLVGAHALGEFVCGRLAKMGTDPRPRDRW